MSLLVSAVFLLDNKEGQVRGSTGGAHVSNRYEWPGWQAAAHTIS